MKHYCNPRSRAVSTLWMFEELDVPHEQIVVDFASGEMQTPGYRTINPMGKVPALVDGSSCTATTRWRGSSESRSANSCCLTPRRERSPSALSSRLCRFAACPRCRWGGPRATSSCSRRRPASSFRSSSPRPAERPPGGNRSPGPSICPPVRPTRTR
ncbi:MAG: glutathione S-transferase [Deltaproteobacteria bacterium]|nr:glutathione S-transferase [Deltaproteobacteria bacterium]